MSVHRTQTTLVDDHWTDSYAKVAEKAALTREIFAARGIKIRSGSALHQLLKQADKLNQAWIAQREPHIQVIIDTLHVNRLVDAISQLSDQPGIEQSLKRIASSAMQPNDRGRSQGKDALWELVLQAQLMSNGAKVRAQEPDLLVELGTTDYPIACKKIWSPANLEKQIQKGCAQLAPFHHAGVIALNLDDLTPPGQVVAQPTKSLAIEFLNRFTMTFIGKYLRLLEQAVVLGRCDGFIVSTAAAAILSQEDTSPYLATHYTLWHTTDKAPEARDRFMAFAVSLNTTSCRN
ncbi:hypothetical protein [Pseudomonas sp. Irchel s3f19]|uniref:hypothetical protein n=1 Tax=Pseudomonas sp. Irchel s3f19 TaxID=2009146 RepID=UPI000BA3B172|nr:hypothetical protein [Pseudomonas sp. Irchel s3f19]